MLQFTQERKLVYYNVPGGDNEYAMLQCTKGDNMLQCTQGRQVLCYNIKRKDKLKVKIL
jgi:hypothetical protein